MQTAYWHTDSLEKTSDHLPILARLSLLRYWSRRYGQKIGRERILASGKRRLYALDRRRIVSRESRDRLYLRQRILVVLLFRIDCREEVARIGETRISCDCPRERRNRTGQVARRGPQDRSEERRGG